MHFKRRSGDEFYISPPVCLALISAAAGIIHYFFR